MVFELTLGNLIALLVAIVAAVWALFKRGDTQRERRFGERLERVEEGLAKLDRTVADSDKRLAHMESAARNALSHDDLGEVYARLHALAEGVNKLAGEFKGVQGVLNLLHEHLLNGGRK